jgi:hypothetical protein
VVAAAVAAVAAVAPLLLVFGGYPPLCMLPFCST